MLIVVFLLLPHFFWLIFYFGKGSNGSIMCTGQVNCHFSCGGRVPAHVFFFAHFSWWRKTTDMPTPLHLYTILEGESQAHVIVVFLFCLTSFWLFFYFCTGCNVGSIICAGQVDCHFFSWWHSFDTGGSHQTLEAAILNFPRNLLALTFSSSYSQVDCSLFFGCMLHWVVATTGELFFVFLLNASCFAFAHGRWLLFLFHTLFLQFCGDQHFTVYCCLWFY